MSFNPSELTHCYVHILENGFEFAYKIENKGLLKKKPQLVDYSNTLELVAEGVEKYGERYVASADTFVFLLPNPTRFFSKVSYDELLTVYSWRHRQNIPYDDAINNKKLSVLDKKNFRIVTELTTMYSKSKNPKDPDFDGDDTELQMGPPIDAIGPDGREFGDFHSRLIYDSLLERLYMASNSNDKMHENLKNKIEDMFEMYENHLKIQGSGFEDLKKIWNSL